MKPVWDGKGVLEDGAVYFTNHNGELVGRPYLRIRVSRYLCRWRAIYSLAERKDALARTVDNDAWLAFRNGMLVSAICRDVEDELLTTRLP